MQKFIPVKIADRQWAKKLLDGDVFMRPLREFGSWGKVEKHRDKQLDNNFRGDIREGTSAVFSAVQDCGYLDNVDPEFRKVIKQVNVIDDEVQFFKIFSLYCMEYDTEHDFFFKPDSRIRSFGDTAVIIKDTPEFIERIGKALFGRYEHLVIYLNRVSFFNFEITRSINPLFEKHESYAYQNELRFAFGKLEKNEYALGSDAEKAMSLVRELEPVTLNIGNIKDIACAMKIDDFLELKLPRRIKLRWPISEIKENPSNFDMLVNYTHEQMKSYTSHAVRPMVEIW